MASYLAGRDVLLIAADWTRCRELSQRIRDDLIHLGLVDATRAVPIAEGGEASVGDLIICRRSDHSIGAGEPMATGASCPTRRRGCSGRCGPPSWLGSMPAR